jgi:hypothetical protein
VTASRRWLGSISKGDPRRRDAVVGSGRHRVKGEGADVEAEERRERDEQRVAREERSLWKLVADWWRAPRR